MRRTYIYRVQPLEGQEWPGGRTHYLSRSAAKNRVWALGEYHGCKAEVVRSEPVEFLAPVVPIRMAS